MGDAPVRGLPYGVNISRCLNKGLAYCIHTAFQGELQAVVVVLGSTNAQVDAR